MPDLDRATFLRGFGEALEWREEVTPDTALAGSDQWDSLAVLSAMAYLDEQLGVTVSASELQSIGTAGELLQMCVSRAESPD